MNARATITIRCSEADMETLMDTQKGELGRWVFYILEKTLSGPIEVHLEMKSGERHCERIWYSDSLKQPQ